MKLIWLQKIAFLLLFDFWFMSYLPMSYLPILFAYLRRKRVKQHTMLTSDSAPSLNKLDEQSRHFC